MNLIAGPNPGLGTWPARRARISPDRTALLDPHRSLTYAELADRTARYAGALRRLGVAPGDRVAYLGVNAVEVFETFFAAWLLGAIAVPLNHRLSGAEIRYMR
jgi:fatty-acyl-CoA synthase